MGVFEPRWVMRVIGFLLMIPGMHGWGKEGHFITCKIAEVFIFLSFGKLFSGFWNLEFGV